MFLRKRENVFILGYSKIKAQFTTVWDKERKKLIKEKEVRKYSHFTTWVTKILSKADDIRNTILRGLFDAKVSIKIITIMR